MGDCTLGMSQNMGTCIDFLEGLEPDMAVKILTCLDDSADLIRASAVSRHWQNLVVCNGLCKQLCMRMFPQLACITHVLEPSRDKSGERDHRAYASLFWAITAFPLFDCIASPVSASSIDHYPAESIMNTLDPRDTIQYRLSYWSSIGTDDPETPETLTDLFDVDLPICSSRFVRFRMGHPKSWKELDYDFIEAQECADDKFIWTYTSPMYPMAQEYRLQRFRLPGPVVCIGGYLQIELLGRVQKAWDEKYYLCVTNIQAIGRKLSPPFRVEFSEPSKAVSLIYDADVFGSILSKHGTRNP